MAAGLVASFAILSAHFPRRVCVCVCNAAGDGIIGVCRCLLSSDRG